MPSLGADMESGTLIEWCVKPGETVKRGQIIAVVGTDKGDIEVEVWEDGVVESIRVPEGQEVPVDTVLAVIGSGAPPKPEPRRIRATPVARRMAEELGIDLSQVVGTGPSRSVQKADIEKFHRAQEPPTKASPAKTKAKPKTSNPSIRRAIAEAMSLSNREIPHYYLKSDIDLTSALSWMDNYNQQRPVSERLLTAMVLARATVMALGSCPDLNAFWKDGEHQRQSDIHLGMAISLRGGGVVIPAILEAQKIPLTELRGAMNDLIKRARSNKLRASELNTATATITNLGDRGAQEVYGIIYPPQVCLVGFGRISERPWAEAGMLGVRPQVTVTLAADHRASDGIVGSRFLEALTQNLQNPETL